MEMEPDGCLPSQAPPTGGGDGATGCDNDAYFSSYEDLEVRIKSHLYSH